MNDYNYMPSYGLMESQPMPSYIPQPPVMPGIHAHNPMKSSIPRARRSRASRACENCRKRKVKCSEGDVCNECRRFGEKCYYREHYRAKREFSVKILQSPDFVDKNDRDRIDMIKPEPLAQDDMKSMYSKNSSNSSDITFVNSPISSGESNTTASSSSGSPVMVNNLIGHNSGVSPPPSIPLNNGLGVSVIQHSNRRSGAVFEFTDKVSMFTNFLPTDHLNTVRSFYEVAPLKTPFDKPIPSASFVSSSAATNTLYESHLTEEQMLQTLASFFIHFHPTLPFLEPDVWLKKAKAVWRAAEYGTPPPCSEVTLGIIYMLNALGCIANNAHRTFFAGVSSYQWGLEYNRKASRAVPDVFEVTSLRMCQYMMLVCMFKYLIGQNQSAYLYGGAISKTIRALSLHKINPQEDNSPEAYEKYRTLFCAIGMEKYTSLRVGRTYFNSIGEVPFAKLYLPAFTASKLSSASAPSLTAFIHLKNKLLTLATFAMAEAYNSTSLPDIISCHDTITRSLGEFDQLLSVSEEPYLRTDDIQILSSLTPSEAKEWLLVHLMVWDLRSVMYRPFLLLLGSLSEPSAADIYNNLDPMVLAAIRSGAEKCVRVQLMSISTLYYNTFRAQDIKSCWFVYDYMLSAVQILLYYELCVLDNECERLPIKAALREAYDFVSNDPNNATAMSLLSMLFDEEKSALARNIPHVRRQFAKSFFLVLDGNQDEDDLCTPSANEFKPLQNEKDILDYWHLCLESVG
ncbi:transcription factor Grt1 (predicted) [Sugiyamaella lignohabitans]|uniref:Transcription factor Grt1 (Predicted) n=1 Tax=Sugiyamaella lignohabitans TaxID=796027 RepID=A0A167DWH0_9ASCO|nr:transcription factor Grt1 (predicted) [Sugiyamaella lignohabitans]ANB13379.1 transcription factor Grt1 (predicted) [Sugiyamaella lignohabitans]